MSGTATDSDETFTGHVLNASLAVMSIFIAVIAVLVVQHKDVASDPVLADPLYNSLIGTMITATVAGLTGIMSLVYLRTHCESVWLIFWLFALLIGTVTTGIPLVVGALLQWW